MKAWGQSELHVVKPDKGNPKKGMLKPSTNKRACFTLLHQLFCWCTLRVSEVTCTTHLGRVVSQSKHLRVSTFWQRVGCILYWICVQPALWMKSHSSLNRDLLVLGELYKFAAISSRTVGPSHLGGWKRKSEKVERSENCMSAFNSIASG